jgi:hypothetical protein
MDFDVDAYLEALLDNAQNRLLNDGKVSPTVIIFTEESVVIKNPFDLSDRVASKQIIQSIIDQYNGQMVVLIYESWVSNDLSTFPSIAADRRKALCVYGENKTESMVMLQEYEIDRGGGVLFGKSSKLKNPPCGALTGFFST